MQIIISLILVFLVGILASFIGSMVGGGGLINIPFLIFMGLPPQVAIATNKFGAVGIAIGSLTKYSMEKKVRWEYVVPFSIIGIFCAFIGANILLNINKELLSKSVGFIILFMLPLIFLRKNLGIKRHKPTKVRKIIGYFFYFLAMIWGAFFGGGGGTLVSYIFMMFFGFTIIESSATNKVPWLIMSLLVLIMFAMHGIIDYLYGIVLFFGMLIGGYLGAHTAVKKGDRWVKYLFAIMVVASAIKLLIS